MLDEVIHDVESDLQTLLNLTTEAGWDDLSAQSRDEIASCKLPVSLEQDAKEFSDSHLQLVLICVLLLD